MEPGGWCGPGREGRPGSVVCGVGLCRRILGMVGGSNFARRRRALVVDSFYQISFQFIDILNKWKGNIR